MSNFDTLIVKQVGAVRYITLNQPQSLNAISSAMAKELTPAFKESASDPEIRAIVIDAEGRSFSAGGDVTNMRNFRGLANRSYIKHHQEWLRTLVSMEKPVIAAVHGYVLGAGLSLASACDIIIAADNAKFGQVFSRVGLAPDLGGMYFLPRRVGVAKAKEMAFTGDIIDAEEALRIGLVNKVIPHDQLEVTVKEFATKVAGGPTQALGIAKVVMNKSMELHLDDILEYESLIQPLLKQTGDFEEGVTAFLEKRPPHFRGE